MQSLWRWLRFGTIYEVIKAVDGGVASEIAYYGRFNRLIGYWAYGYFDPKYPYRGDE